MEENKLFRGIWRFNAIVIAMVGVLAIAVLFFALYTIYKEWNRDRHRHDIVNIDSEANIKESFRLGRIVHVKGYSTVIIPLYSDQEFSHGYSGSKSTASTRNLLFSNIRTETNKWILPTNEFLIVDHQLINESNYYDETKDVITILYEIVKTDTNNDSRLTDNDKLTIAFSNPEGNNYTEVLTNIDELLGYEVIDQKLMAIVYSRANHSYTAYIDISNFSITKEVELPKFD